jgi:hypothetical protein
MSKSASAYGTRKIAPEKPPLKLIPLKVDFLDMERRWLSLARSYELTGQLTDFSAETKREANNRSV